METRNYKVTLKHWLTRREIHLILGETLTLAKEQLKILRKKHSRFWWFKTSPIHC